jgi:ankyrin repeat protein
MAAYFGRPKIVEELLDRGAAINDSEDMEDTPLHMAAAAGHVEVMKKLIHRGANLKAVSLSSGLVINSAIFSGKREAVELLVDRGVPLTAIGDDAEPPLAQAASLSEVSMLEYLIERYADKLPPEDYSEALVSAARAGRVPVVNRLLEFPHTTEYFQRALDEAAEEGAWEAVKILLEKCSNLNCDQPFYEAATGTEPQDIVLEALWEYTQGGISAEKLDESLYDATDREKESTVKILLDKFGADPNASGEE